MTCMVMWIQGDVDSYVEVIQVDDVALQWLLTGVQPDLLQASRYRPWSPPFAAKPHCALLCSTPEHHHHETLAHTFHLCTTSHPPLRDLNHGEPAISRRPVVRGQHSVLEAV